MAFGPLGTHPDLPVGHLRVAQVLAVAWLFTGQSLVWPGSVAWSVACALVSTALCAVVLLTPWTRLGCAALSALIALAIVIEPAWFSNNRAFVAALLLAISLSSSAVASFPRWQVALVYLVAAADKALAPAWRDGQFVNSFIEQLARFGLMWAPGGGAGSPNALAEVLADVGSPSLWTGVGLLVIAGEAILGVGFLFNLRWVAWLNALFHVSVFAVTGGTMGQFFFAGAAASLLLVAPAFVPRAWPLMGLTALLAGPWTHRFFPLLALLLGFVWWWRVRVTRSGATTSAALETE